MNAASFGQYAKAHNCELSSLKNIRGNEQEQCHVVIVDGSGSN
eukprot:COSAG05_NODE_15342_length_372_cov_0.739927_1_plen_42_part_10